MSVSSSDDDTNWKVDLEILVLDNDDFASIRQVCKNRPFPDHLRRDIWRIYLKPNGITSTSDSDFTPAQNLPQDLLAEATKAAERALENAKDLSSRINSRNDDIFERLSVTSNDEPDCPSVTGQKTETVESLGEKFGQICVLYSTEYSRQFHPNNGWLEILCMLYEVLECSRPSELYSYFLSVQHRFIANGFLEDNRTCNVLRLLLQYHEPLVCSLFECNKLSFETFSVEWFTTLFASTTSRVTAYALWDLYFLQSNPLLKIFIALVLLVNAKNDLIALEQEEVLSDDEEILTKDLEYKSRLQLKTYEKGELLTKVSDLTKPMEVSDLPSLIEIALSYLNTTPNSFRQRYLELLFCNVDITDSANLFTSALCLHVSPQELINWHKTALRQYQTMNDDLASMDGTVEATEIDYLPIDLRSPEEYNAGHLKAAFFLDVKQKVDDPGLFRKRVQSLFEMQRKTKSKIGHIILMGSVYDGSLSDERYSENVSNLNMVIAYFLRLQICNVAVLEGGYAALHEALGTFGIKEHFSSHAPEKCCVCRVDPNHQKQNIAPQTLKQIQNTAQKAANMANDGLLKKFSSIFSQPVNTMQSVNRIYPSLGKTACQNNVVIGGSKETGKVAYRNTDSVFTIDDESTSEGEEDQNGQTIQAARELESSPKKMNQLSSQEGFLDSPEDLQDYPHRSGGLDECQMGDRVVTCNLASRPELKGHFSCFYVNNENNKCGTGHFLVTQANIIFLRDEKSLIGTQFVPLSNTISNVGKQFKSWISTKVVVQTSEDRIHERRPEARKIDRECVVNRINIDEVIRINTNRKIPEIISFIHGKGELLSMGQQPNRYRVYIPKAGEAVNLIKTLIYHSDSNKPPTLSPPVTEKNDEAPILQEVPLDVEL